MTTIKLKNGSGAPSAGALVVAEPALDLTNKRLYTEDSGGTVIEVGTNPTSVTTGDITATGTATFAGLTTTADVSFGDNDKAIFGDGSDLQIYHDGSNSYVTEGGSGTGNLIVQANNLFLRNGAGTVLAGFYSDGTSRLLHNGSTKLDTTSTGIDVTGTVVSDGLTLANATYIRQNDSASGQPRVFGFNASNDMYMGPIDSYAGGAMFYGVSSGVSSQVLYTDAKQRLRISSDGDISFYEDTGTTAKFFWDASAESLGIGTSSPSKTLDIEGNIRAKNTEGSSGAEIDITSGSTWRFRSNATTGTNSYGLDIIKGSAGTDVKMSIDSSGQVGIGTSSPSGALDIGGQHILYDNFDALGASFTRNGTYGSVLSLGRQGVSSGVTLDYPADNTFALSTNATERMRIDSSGDVGIGVTSPEATLTVSSGSANNVANFKSTDGTAYIAIADNSSTGALHNQIGVIGDNMFFATNDTERMRIDASGNLLVGKTAANFTVAGHEIKPGGFAGFTRDGGAPVVVNRLTDNGDLIEFYRGASGVGSIGTLNTNRIFFGGADTGFMIASDLDCIYPTNGGDTARDNAVDLGNSGTRFKDLYLSGGAYLGGTASANLLDDYEEGTFTPELRDATSGGNTATTTHKHGLYTKVGSLVTIWMHFRNIDTTGMTSGNPIYITGLPFTADNNLYTSGAVSTDRVSWSGNYLTFSVTENDAYGLLSIITSNAQDASLTVAGIDGTGSDIQGICVQYRTA